VLTSLYRSWEGVTPRAVKWASGWP